MLAVCEKGNLFSAPDTYMEKIAIGQNLPKNLLDLDFGLKKSQIAFRGQKKRYKTNYCVSFKRPRHDKIVQSLKKLESK